MQLASEQQIFVLIDYSRTRSIKEVQQLFARSFRDRVASTEFAIRKNVEKYKTEGSCFNLNKYRSGSGKTERTQEYINLLQEKLIEDPKTSARENCLDISKSTFNRITKRDLEWHPYKIQVRKERTN